MQGTFQSWWNERYFYTSNPLYATFRKLYGLGIDLDYVDFLCDTLGMGDNLQLLRPKPKVDSNYQLIGKFVRTHGDYLVGLFRLFGTLAVGFTVKRITELYLTKEEPVTLLSAQEVKRIISETSFAVADFLANNIDNRTKARQAQTLESTERLKAKSVDAPIIRLIMEYNNPTPPRRGNKADPWGTLFLLAVTEYLRESTGKPHYGEAVKLLQKTRAPYERKFHKRVGHIPKTNAQSALVRVKNVKHANPSWQEALVLFKDQFRLSPKSKKHDRS